jgi:CheY-like chemotaxis protein
METIITWLIGIERRAQRLYSACAAALPAQELAAARILKRLAEDEARHAAYLEKARRCRRKSAAEAAGIRLDPVTIRNVEAPFNQLDEALDRDLREPETIVTCITSAEQSEWNDIFLYAIDSVKSHCRDLAHVAPRMQHHLRYIRKSLGPLLPAREGMDALETLPPVWQEKFLVVDDEDPIVALLQTVLSREGRVYTAADGRQALEMAMRDYFAVIVSDIDMPVMDGWAFYSRLEKAFRGVGRRFIFMTGNPTSRAAQKIARAGCRILSKPFSLTELRQAVDAAMEGIARAECAPVGRP